MFAGVSATINSHQQLASRAQLISNAPGKIVRWIHKINTIVVGRCRAKYCGRFAVRLRVVDQLLAFLDDAKIFELNEFVGLHVVEEGKECDKFLILVFL